MPENYQTIFMNMPFKIKGFVVYDPCDDYYTIVLNPRLSHDENIATFWHELKHIALGDFYKLGDVNLIEALAH